ncbi:hypothetical protein [Solibacillus cecembensis]|uniref:hypothetical protein n=1 Tax=Solibacillus cecembensis TaxID=459347 RepID=UPI003CFD4193
MKKPKEKAPKLLAENEDLEIIDLNCCDKTITVNLDHKVANVYCPFCGVSYMSQEVVLSGVASGKCGFTR